MIRRTLSPESSPPAASLGVAGIAWVIPAGVLVLLGASAVAGTWDAGHAPFPFVWRDVALVYALAALPLAWVVAGVVCRRLPVGGALALAAALLAAGVVLLAAGEEFEAAVLSNRLLGYASRTAAAFAFVLSVAVAANVLLGGREGGRFPTGIAVVGAFALAVLPATHVGARCRHDGVRLGEYLEQSRVGEARDLARGLLALGCRKEVRGLPLAEVSAELDRVTRDLESRVGGPVSALATTAGRLDRARTLAMLGRTGEALEVLARAVGAEAEMLRGTIRQTRGEWEESREAFEKARAAWGARPASPTRERAETDALAGVAYAERKLGQYAEAETTYREVLARAPTADTHFLLAQFYDDTQQTRQAREHARRAMELAPDRYRQEGERLIRKLTLYHFGCFSLYPAGGE